MPDQRDEQNLADQPPPGHPKRKWRRWRWRRWLLFKLAFLLFAVGGAYWYVANPRRAAGLAEGLLAGITGADVSIASARFGLDGTIALNQLVLSLPDADNEFGRLFAAEQVFIEHDLARLLLGQFHPTVINFTRPVIYRCEDVRTGKINFQVLHALSMLEPRRPLPTYLPQVRLPEGRVRFCEYDGEKLSTIHFGQIEGRVLPDHEQADLYRFTLMLKQHSASGGATLTGTYNPRDQTFNAETDDFTIDDTLGKWLPRAWRQWWNDHEPSGTMLRMRFGYDIDHQEIFAQAQIGGARIIPPYAPFVEAGIGMTEVSGRFTFSNDHVKVENLVGLIEGIHYEINGDLRGFDKDAPFRLSIQAERFHIPEQPQHLMVMPEPVIRMFRKFKPVGQFSAQVALERKERGGTLSYDGTVSMHDVSMIYDRFPYKLEKIQGEMKFSDQMIKLSVKGKGATGADVDISGTRRPAGPDAAQDLIITAHNVPLDRALYEAFLEPHHRAAYDRLFSKPHHQRLIEAGLIQSIDRRDANGNRLQQLLAQRDSLDASEDQAVASLEGQIDKLRRLLDRPVFDLGGRIDCTARVERGPGPGVKPRITTTVDGTEVNMLISDWPYPVVIDEGRLIITSGQTVVEGLVAHSAASPGSRITADGRIARSGDNVLPDIRLSVHDVLVDDLLFAAVQAEPRKRMRSLQIGGRLDATGNVFADSDGRIDFVVATELSDGAANPFGGRFKIDHLTGRATVARDRISFDHMEGTHGNSRISFTGHVDWGAGQRESVLHAEAQQLRFEDPVTDIFPFVETMAAAIEGLVAKHKPEGVYNATLDYVVRGEAPAEIRLSLRPDTIAFDLRGQRISLHDMHGSIRFDPQQITVDALGASFENGQFTTVGQVKLGQDPVFDLTIDANAGQFDQISRAVLPDAVRQAIENLHFDGGYELRQTRFVYRPQAKEQPVVTVKGVVRLTDASAVIALPIKRLTGDLHFDAVYRAGEPWPRINMQLNARQLRVFDRRISPLTVAISNAPHLDVLVIKDLEGRCYEGTLAGSGFVELGDHGYYRMKGALVDCQVRPFIKPRAYELADGGSVNAGAKPITPAHEQTHGLLTASLAIEGITGQDTTRQGRGEMVIRRANLYELPLSLALLQMVNLTFPTSRAFDRASAQYLIDGDMILFDHLVFEAPSVRVAGTGTMHYSTRQLDLDMATSNPAAWKLGPLSTMIARLKDELVSIHVGGTLEKPEAKINSFRGTAKSWMSIFGRPRRTVTIGSRPVGGPFVAADQ